jgi:hypothetical protein
METLTSLIGSLRERCARLPDKRTGANGRYAMADVGMAAFLVFFMQSPSFLAHQRHLAQGQGAFELREPVRDDGDPVRQPHPGAAGSGLARAF